MGTAEAFPRTAETIPLPPPAVRPNDLASLCRLVMANAEASHGWVLAQVDIANLRAINTLFGHDHGDRLIALVASTLSIHSGFCWYRVSGGDWIGIAAEMPEILARDSLQQLQAELSLRAAAEANISMGADISIGVACGTDLGELICLADLACRRAKIMGRGKLVLQQEPTANPSPILRALLTRKSLDGVIDLYHQRVVHRDLQDHFEILSRACGLSVGPIIGLIDGMGLAQDFDLAVLDMALRAVPEKAPLHAVNLSASTICDPATMEHVAARLKGRTNIALEVTETAIMTSPGEAVAAITQLRENGHQVFLDDFGEGATTFGMLDMPFSSIKLGKSLSDDMCAPDILAAVLSLSRTRALPVIAEMVETTSQFLRLLNAGVHGFQGHLIHRPEPLALSRFRT